MIKNLVLFSVVALLTPHLTFAQWDSLGTTGISGGSATYISTAATSGGTPYMAYQDGGHSGKLCVKKFNGSSWDTVGSSTGISVGTAYYCAIAMSGKDTPYVAFQDYGVSQKASVMKYNGSNWVNVGTAGFSPGVAPFLSMALGSNDTPYVAFRDGQRSLRATVMKFNGSSWDTVGTRGFSTSVVTYTSIAVNSSGTPYVAFRDGSVTNKATVMKYNGSSWSVVGSAGISLSTASYCSLVVGHNDSLYLAFSDGSTGKVSVMEFDGTNWDTLGTRWVSPSTASYPSLAIDDKDTLYLAYEDNSVSNKASVMKYKGSSWVNVGSAGISASTASYTSICIADTALFLAYEDVNNGNKTTGMSYSRISNTWTGSSSSSWGTGGNWSTGAAPDSTVTIKIPAGLSTYPSISSGTVSCKSLVIESGASLDVGSGATLRIAGGIFNSGTLSDTAGTIELMGSAAQSIPSGAFYNNTIKNLTINNSSGVTLAGTLKLKGTLTPTAGTLTTGGYLTLVSDSLGTASVAQGSSSGGYVSGNVSVERFIPANSNRAWRLLSANTSGAQTIQSAWQEGATSSSSNPNPGYGTLITCNSSYSTADGFDAVTHSMSILAYDTANQSWTTNPVTNTNVKALSSEQGYFLYLRGDRSVSTSTSTSSPTHLTLRSLGSLFMGDQAAITVPAGDFVLVGNPYPANIDFSAIASADRLNIGNKFWLWDPKLTGSYGVGGYVLFDASTTTPWTPSTTGGSYSSANSIIPSGMAFFVLGGTSDGSITLRESIKASGGAYNGFRTTGATKQLHVELGYVRPDSSLANADGVFALFNNAFSAAIDDQDVDKLINSGENLAIQNSGHVLGLDARPVSEYDTVQLKIWNIKTGNYRFTVTPSNLAAAAAYLIDNYNHTATALSISAPSVYNFSINTDSGSFAADRFFIALHIVTTGIGKVNENNSITLYPNPAGNTDDVHIAFNNIASGYYNIAIYDMTGRRLSSRSVNYNGGNAIYQLNTRSLLPGNYNVIVEHDHTIYSSIKLSVK